MPTKLPQPAYPGHDLGRRVSHAGTFRFQSRQLFISDTLRHEDIACEESGDGVWSLDFYALRLARRDERDFKLYA
jgi:putative transposase